MPRPNTLAHTTPAHQSGHKHHSSSSPHPDTRGWGQTATRRMPASTQRRRATKPTTVGLWRVSPSYLPHTPRRRCPGTAAIRTRPSTRRHARGSSEDGGSEALASSARDLATTTALHEQVRHIDPVCWAGTCGAGSERGNGTVSAGELAAACGHHLLTNRISLGGYSTCTAFPTPPS